MNYASLIFYTVTSRSVKGAEPLCFIHLFIYFHFQKNGGLGDDEVAESNVILPGEKLSIGSVISHQCGCWGRDLEVKDKIVKTQQTQK